MLGTADFLMLTGAVLTIIIISVILIWTGFIPLTVAFFSLKTQPATSAPPQSQLSPA